MSQPIDIDFDNINELLQFASRERYKDVWANRYYDDVTALVQVIRQMAAPTPQVAAEPSGGFTLPPEALPRHGEFSAAQRAQQAQDDVQ